MTLHLFASWWSGYRALYPLERAVPVSRMRTTLRHLERALAAVDEDGRRLPAPGPIVPLALAEISSALSCEVCSATTSAKARYCDACQPTMRAIEQGKTGSVDG